MPGETIITVLTHQSEPSNLEALVHGILRLSVFHSSMAGQGLDRAVKYRDL